MVRVLCLSLHRTFVAHCRSHSPLFHTYDGAADNAAWYADNAELEMKRATDVGGMETLNIWTNTASGYLGYAYFVGNK